MWEGYIRAGILVSMATDSSNILTKGKHEQTFFSETTIPRALMFLCVAMHSTPLYKSCQPCPWGPYRLRPRVSLPAIGLQWEIHEHFFSETTRPKASVFGMQHCYMELDISPAKHPIGHLMARIFLQLDKTLKKSSSLKPHGLVHLY